MGERPGNRALACERAGVEPRFRTYDGDDLIPFVVSLNLHRRHLSESQRAMVAGQIANMTEGRQRATGEISPVSCDQAAELLNVSRSSVVNARTVMQQGTPEEIEAAKAGAVAVGTLAKDIRKGVPPEARGLNRPKAEPVRGPRVIPPAGETPEAMFRRGIALMRDGRNRALACERARVEPRFRTYDGDDLIPFVVSLNLHRRHLSESQRAMVAGQIANMRSGARTDLGEISPRSVSTDQAAELLNVSRSSVVNARTVMQQGTPEEIEAAKAGAVAVGTLAKDIRKGVPPAERGLNKPKAEPVRGPRSPS